MHHVLPTITDLRDPALTQALRAALDNKTKPLGSLGRLEALSSDRRVGREYRRACIPNR